MHNGFERGFERMREQLSRRAQELPGASQRVFVPAFWGSAWRRWESVFCPRAGFLPQAWMPGSSACTCGRAPGCGSKRRRGCAMRSKQVIRREIPPSEVKTILDNIGLPYSGINTSYSTSGTIGTSDAEILVSLDAEHHHPTEQYVQQTAEGTAGDVSGSGVLLSAGGHRQPDFELWIAVADRYSGTGATIPAGNYDIAQQIANRAAAHSGRGGCPRSADDG